MSQKMNKTLTFIKMRVKSLSLIKRRTWREINYLFFLWPICPFFFLLGILQVAFRKCKKKKMTDDVLYLLDPLDSLEFWDWTLVTDVDMGLPLCSELIEAVGDCLVLDQSRHNCWKSKAHTSSLLSLAGRQNCWWCPKACFLIFRKIIVTPHFKLSSLYPIMMIHYWGLQGPNNFFKCFHEESNCLGFYRSKSTCCSEIRDIDFFSRLWTNKKDLWWG